MTVIGDPFAFVIASEAKPSRGGLRFLFSIEIVFEGVANE